MEVVKDWKTVYEFLSEAKPPLRLRVLDTVVFDSLAVHRPLFKIFTNASEEVCSVNLRASSIDKVVQDVLTATAAIVTLHTQIKLNGPAREKLALCSKGSSRFLLDLHGLASLSVSHSSGFDGLTILKRPGCSFGSRVYVHEVTQDDSEVRVRDLGSASEKQEKIDSELTHLVKQSSAVLRDKLGQVSRQDIKQMTACYRFDECKRQVWLLGIDKCIMTEMRTSVCARKASSVSVLHLNNSFQLSQSESSSLFQRTRTPSRLSQTKWRQQRAAKQRKTRFPGWAQVKDYGSQHVVHLVDSSFLQRSSTLASFKPFLEFPTYHTPQRQALKTNESAFKQAAFVERLQVVSKAGVTGQESEIERTLREAHSQVAFESKCRGAFCASDVQGYQQPATYPEDSRFLVMEDLIFAAKTPEFSPEFHPNFLRVKPLSISGKKLPFKKPVRTPFSVGKLFTQNEDVYAPVCLKCFLVYYNVQEAIIAAAGIEKHE